jgi:hypothetical protein
MEKYTFDANIVSDLHKDAYGYRPREWFWSQWNGCGDEGKQALWDELLADLSDAVSEEKAREAAAIVATEERIAQIIDMVAGSTREDAIRYLEEAYEVTGDRSFLEYHLDVPYGYLGGRIAGWLAGPVAV